MVPTPTPAGLVSQPLSVLARISRDIGGLHATHYGKGPKRTKTHRDGDVLMVVMRDNLTAVEKTLVEGGRDAEVHALRRAFQDVKREEMTTIVEEALGRRVETFMSQVSLDPDVNVEIFLLVPVPWEQEGPQRSRYEERGQNGFGA
jgi:uncharacterized protein YbcI